jgi:RNA polymerase sigma factor (sigma-70 family)
MASLCVRYIRDKQDAMQVLNDGFLKVFTKIKLYDADKAGLYTWMRKIIINTTIDFLRKAPVIYTNNLIEIKDETTIENYVIQKMNADELLNLVKQLPGATQVVFNLYTVDGFNHREIGEMLNISEGTSKWHVSEARKQLKKLIGLKYTKT